MYKYYVTNYGNSIGKVPANSFTLSKDDWDDFGFITMFHMYYIDVNYERIPIGEIKISFIGQKPRADYAQIYTDRTYNKISPVFEEIGDDFYSLGQTPEFYEKLFSIFGNESIQILSQINDLATNPSAVSKYSDESAFTASLLRTVDTWQIKNQFSRILSGGAKLSDYDFEFNYLGNDIKFNVEALSTPPTNTHALIGRNGVGKTSILNAMFNQLIQENKDGIFTKYLNTRGATWSEKIDSEYFSKVIYITYSIFGEYFPDIIDSQRFSYIGVKEKNKDNEYYIKNIKDLSNEFFTHLGDIRSSNSMTEIFEEILMYFTDSYEHSVISSLLQGAKNNFTPEDFRTLSSGHAMVLLVIVNLIANVVEKTLVLFDEPETHLHPPLLSALIRAINDILVKKNGVCIFATHSPVVLQEIPKSCIYAMSRYGDDIKFERPEVETFGENVSTLTHEIFSLEVKSTGFYNLLRKKFDDNNSVREIKEEFDKQLGSEAVSLLYLLQHNKTAKLNGYPEA